MLYFVSIYLRLSFNFVKYAMLQCCIVWKIIISIVINFIQLQLHSSGFFYHLKFFDRFLSYFLKCSSNLSSNIHHIDRRIIQNLAGHIWRNMRYAFLLLYRCRPIPLPFPLRKFHSKVFHNLLLKYEHQFSVIVYAFIITSKSEYMI